MLKRFIISLGDELFIASVFADSFDEKNRVFYKDGKPIAAVENMFNVGDSGGRMER